MKNLFTITTQERNNMRYCYWINEFQSKEEHKENGVNAKGFVPSIVTENVAGFSYASYPTKEDRLRLPYFWSNGFDEKGLQEAKKICEEKNKSLGLSKLDVQKIICSSMFAGEENK